MAESTSHNQISYASEIGRKAIHLASLAIPIVYLNIEHWTGVTILLAMTTTSFIMDVLRHWHEPSRKLLFLLVGKLLREHESAEGPFRLTGATWVLIAATITLATFPTIVGVVSFSVLIVSDTCAALVGRRVRSRPFFDKSLAGSIAFAISAYCVVIVYAWIFSAPTSLLIAGVVAAPISAIVESASIRLRMDDNLSIPFSFATTLLLVDVVLAQLGFTPFIGMLP